MRSLYLCPLKKELEGLLKGLKLQGVEIEPAESPAGRIFRSAEGDVFAVGGLGRAKFQEKAIRLLQILKPQRLVVLGSAGSLSFNRTVGDVFYAKELICRQEDLRIYDKIDVPQDPFLKPLSLKPAKIFCVEESLEENHSLRAEPQLSEALVAQESWGAFSAASQQSVFYSEIRVITDFANAQAPQDFHTNLEKAMLKLAETVLPLLKSSTAS